MTKQEFIDWFYEQKPYWPTPPECYDKITASQPQEGQDEKAVCSHCGDVIEHPLCRNCEIALTLPDDEY